MKSKIVQVALVVVLAIGAGMALVMCTGAGNSTDSSGTNDGPTGSGTTGDGTTTGCTLDDNTTETSTVNSYGCHVLTRDTTSCQTARTAQGLSGFWLKFSCRVTLTKSAGNVTVKTDDQPDYKTQYFGSSHACYEAFTGRSTNPNTIATQNISMTVPFAPATTTASHVSGAIIGLALNGVGIYGNFAAPGDDIYREVQSFDKCDGHPDGNSRYHNHTEPESITQNDSAFVGVMRDGFPIYGRKDSNGSTPTLDSSGGHTGVTADSPSVSVYHYHVNLQTNTNPTPQPNDAPNGYFLSTGFYAGTPGSCTGCN